jgi:hypothetical protein
MGEKASIMRHDDARDEAFAGNEGGDAEVIAFPEPEDENGDLPADSEGGRCWVRTSDPCVVSAVLSH